MSDADTPTPVEAQVSFQPIPRQCALCKGGRPKIVALIVTALGPKAVCLCEGCVKDAKERMQKVEPARTH